MRLFEIKANNFTAIVYADGLDEAWKLFKERYNSVELTVKDDDLETIKLVASETADDGVLFPCTTLISKETKQHCELDKYKDACDALRKKVDELSQALERQRNEYGDNHNKVKALTDENTSLKSQLKSANRALEQLLCKEDIEKQESEMRAKRLEQQEDSSRNYE